MPAADQPEMRRDQPRIGPLARGDARHHEIHRAEEDEADEAIQAQVRMADGVVREVGDGVHAAQRLERALHRAGRIHQAAPPMKRSVGDQRNAAGNRAASGTGSP